MTLEPLSISIAMLAAMMTSWNGLLLFPRLPMSLVRTRPPGLMHRAVLLDPKDTGPTGPSASRESSTRQVRGHSVQGPSPHACLSTRREAGHNKEGDLS